MDNPVITGVRIKEVFVDEKRKIQKRIMAKYPHNEGSGMTLIKSIYDVEVEINGEWKKIWELHPNFKIG